MKFAMIRVIRVKMFWFPRGLFPLGESVSALATQGVA